MRCVLDASMALSFVLADEFTADSQRALATIAVDGALVPALWEFEVLNGLRSAERRGRITEAALTNALHGLAGLRIETHRQSVDRPQILALATRLDLSVYDASYAWVAMDTNLPLATLDVRLGKAAAEVGIALI
jgi:predicted nucleic acid-binding protein